jgi:hypothetical protein
VLEVTQAQQQQQQQFSAAAALPLPRPWRVRFQPVQRGAVRHRAVHRRCRHLLVQKRGTAASANGSVVVRYEAWANEPGNDAASAIVRSRRSSSSAWIIRCRPLVELHALQGSFSAPTTTDHAAAAAPLGPGSASIAQPQTAFHRQRTQQQAQMLRCRAAAAAAAAAGLAVPWHRRWHPSLPSESASQLQDLHTASAASTESPGSG